MRAVGPEAKGLIRTLGVNPPHGLDKKSVVLLDEAHRARTGLRQRRAPQSLLLSKMLRDAAALVLFLDERQIIRPGEGATLAELQALAVQHQAGFQHIDLTTQFRCGGSQAYQRWIDAVLSPANNPQPWEGRDYDLTSPPTPAPWRPGSTTTYRPATVPV